MAGNKAMTSVAVWPCVLLADRHTACVEGLRDMLMSAFNTIYVVADSKSLCEGALRLRPSAIVVDLGLADTEATALLQQLRQLSANARLITLTLHDQPAAALALLEAGADAVVLKRCIARDLLEAVDTVQLGQRFVSPDIGLTGN